MPAEVQKRARVLSVGCAGSTSVGHPGERKWRDQEGMFQEPGICLISTA